jgi:hypothetical protein
MTTMTTNHPAARCGRPTLTEPCAVPVRHPAEACPRHALGDEGPLIFEIHEHARVIAGLTNTDKAYALNLIYGGERRDWRPEELPGALLRAMYLTAALRLGVSHDVVRATLPKRPQV